MCNFLDYRKELWIFPLPEEVSCLLVVFPGLCRCLSASVGSRVLEWLFYFFSGASGRSGSSSFKLSVWRSPPPLVGSEEESDLTPPPTTTAAYLREDRSMLTPSGLYSESLVSRSILYQFIRGFSLLLCNFLPSVHRC